MTTLKRLSLVSMLFLALTARAETVVWVAPDGRDDAAGTEARPFQTLGRARDAVRVLVRAGLKDNVVVRLRGGDYRLTETLTLTPEDSGTVEHSVTFASADGERATLKGSRVLSGRWEQVDGTLWKLAVPETAGGKWAFRQLFRDGVSQQRAREPNQKFFTLKSVDSSRRTATLNETLPAAWTGLQGVELNATAYWHFSRQPVAEIDAKRGTVTARRGIGTETSSSKFGGKGHERIWLENALVFADQPGEWFLDTTGAVLYYRGGEGEDPNRTQFSAPALREFIIVQGDAKKLVRNVHFVGLGFAETDPEYPAEGRLGVQAGAWTFDRSRTYSPGAALRFIYAWGTSVIKCRFTELGDGGVSYEIGTRSGRVAECEFTRVGANVIQVGRLPEYTGDRHPLHRDFSGWGAWSDSLEAFPSSNAIWHHTSQTVPEAPSRIDLVDNRIFDCCQIDYGSVGIWVGYANHVHIERNHLRGLPYTGISVGWRWGPGLTNCHSNLIAKNTVEEVMRQVGDGAGIYVVGEQPGTRILDNYVRDSGGNYWSHGIYMDESSDHMEVAGNYVNSVANHSMFMNRNGLNQVFRDNNGEPGPTQLTGNPEGRFWVVFKPERRPPGAESAKSAK